MTERGANAGPDPDASAMILSGWGNFPKLNGRLSIPDTPATLERIVASETPLIARGAGRAYGDAALGQGLTLSTARMNRMIAFDPATGALTVEAGARLDDIISAFLPRGFFPAIVPGTANVSVGGMIAADVHGKNHHRDGGMGRRLERLSLIGPGGEVLECSPERNAELFGATIGGMGLTGVIRDATFRLRKVDSAYIRQRAVAARDIEQALDVFEASADVTYSVGWIDCAARGRSLGRSIIFLGEHADAGSLPVSVRGLPLSWRAPRRKTMPIDLPDFALNPLSVSAFNTLYFHKNARDRRERLVPWKDYFFPLDSIEHWNRMYGRRGFVQHQCLIPHGSARAILPEILDRIASSGQASFLAVLKLMGEGDGGLMSFPMKGYTLALDFPVSDANLRLLDDLDRRLAACGGRLYLAKDARQSRATLEAGYPMLDRFRALRRETGADRAFRSAMSDRLGL